MSIDFSPQRWNAVRTAANAWWRHELDRPLFVLSQWGRDPGRPAPGLPMHHFTAFYDLSISAEQIVDVWNHHLGCQTYLGDGFPNVWPNFGPGVLAAFLGASLKCETSTVWFYPPEPKPLRDLHFELDRDSVWFKRVRAILRAGADRWGGQALVGMTDLGGTLDVLSTFRPSEALLYDLVDEPGEVKRLTWEIHELWMEAFGVFADDMRGVNPGYSGWAGFFSETSHYMLQCDFAYMLGPAMFREFVLPELAATCKRLDNAFYHLDGPGQLPHLDMLLELPELKGIQWIPGEGQPDVSQWPEVYRRIKAAGKLIQVFTFQYPGGLSIADVLAEQLGDLKGVVIVGGAPPAEKDGETRALFARHGVPWEG